MAPTIIRKVAITQKFAIIKISAAIVAISIQRCIAIPPAYFITYYVKGS